MEYLKKIPVSIWVGAAAILIILLGWYFNVWQVRGVEDSFPYLEISKPLPELHRIEPQSTLPGETVVLHGARLEAFDPQSSRVVIGSLPSEVGNWERERARITVKVPQDLKPGRYPVSVQIGQRQSAEKVFLEIRLLSREFAQQVENGERVLILVARFEDSQKGEALQTDLIEQMRYYVSQDEFLADKLLIERWPETVTGDVSVLLAEISSSTHAQLILFGRSGAGGNFYPRIFSNPRAEDVFLSAEKQLTPASLTQMQVGSLNTYEMAAQPIKEPLRTARLLLGLSRYQMGDNRGARSILSDLLNEKDLEAVDKASVRLALGRVTIAIGTEILEKSLLSKTDVRRGDALLTEGMDHLKQAAQELERFPDRRHQMAQVYIARGQAAQRLPFRDKRKNHKLSVEYLEKALQYLDCEKEFKICMIAYDNQGANYDWLASLEWDRGIKDDLLDKSIKLSNKALEMYAARVRENRERLDGRRVDKELLEFERIWLRNQRGIVKGQLYRGDRDQNLKEAVEAGNNALPIFAARGVDMRGRVALTYNQIGIGLLNQKGNRAELLRQADEAFDEGLTYVGPESFPKLYQLLRDNKKLAERLMDQGNKMYEGETAGRYEAEYDRNFRAGQYPDAENQAISYLNWAWLEFKRAHPYYTATAHALLGRIARQADEVAIALSHAISARTILSRNKKLDYMRSLQASNLDQMISELAKANDYNEIEVKTLLSNTKNGFQLYLKFKVDGDRLLASSPAEAINSYNAALSVYPFDPFVLVDRSNAKRRMGDMEGYWTDLSNAILIYPGDPIARYNRAQFYLSVQHWRDALEDVDVAIRIGAEGAYFYVLRAAAYVGLGKKQKALADYQVALLRADGEELRKSIEVRIGNLESESID